MENKATHGAWAGITSLVVAVSGLLFAFKDTVTTNVVSEEDAKTIMLQHEKNDLVEDKVRLLDEFRQDDRIGDLEVYNIDAVEQMKKTQDDLLFLQTQTVQASEQNTLILEEIRSLKE